MHEKLLLIDTFNFLHRAYHALPSTFRDSNGEPVNAVYGVTSMLIGIFETVKPDYVVAALDGQAPTFRVENFTSYKAHRKELDEDLATQIPKVFEILNAFGIKKIVVEGYEADDVIGTLAKRFSSKDLDVLISSNDRDLWQLLGKNVMVILPAKGGQVEWVGEEEAKARLSFDPKLITEYKALAGDASDNIPGVFGVGEKTAKRLILEYDTVEEIYKNISSIKPNSLKEKLAENAEMAVMSRNLATIETNVPITLELSECKYKEFNKVAVVEVLKKYNFKSLIKRLGFGDKKEAKKQETPDNQISLL